MTLKEFARYLSVDTDIVLYGFSKKESLVLNFKMAKDYLNSTDLGNIEVRTGCVSSARDGKRLEIYTHMPDEIIAAWAEYIRKEWFSC